MTVRIVTDSACDLTDAEVASHGIEIVPLSIRFGDEEFIDREFSRKPHRQIRIKWYWWATALVLAGLMVSGVLWAIF